MLSGISIWQLLILLVIVVLVFGTKRLRNLGGDLGSALKDFRGAMKEHDDKKNAESSDNADEDPQVVDHVASNQARSGTVEDAQRRNAGHGDSEKRG